MPFAVIYASNMSLSVSHIKNIHIAPNSRLVLCPVVAKDLCLVVATDAKEAVATWTVGDRSDRVAVERLKVFEWFQLTAHVTKVPYF